ncbi:MAG TPA: phosphatase PAP2 family protein [Actinomycetes bacterium]|nr:phosphatase PAP2 family protein [Actinomycetes bacterium]
MHTKRPGTWRSGTAFRTTAWLVGVALACVVLLVLTYELAVHTRRGRLLDGASLRGAVDSRSDVTGALEQLLDVVSVASLLAAAAALVAIALLRMRRELAIAAVVVLVGSNVTSQVLKNYLLERPDLGLQESTPATLNSMPSGHSTVAFSVAVALVLVLPVRLRAAAAGFGVAYASVAALSTLSAGWHRPSDSVAAFLVVGVWATAVGAVLVVRHGDEQVDTDTGSHSTTTRRLAAAAAYLLAFGALVAVVILTTQLDTYGQAAQVLAYVAGGGAIAGTGCAVMAAVLAVTHRIAPRAGAARGADAEADPATDES